MSSSVFLFIFLTALSGSYGQTVQRQILFLADSTSSISSSDFVTYKQAFESVADLLDLESGQTQAAIAQYGNQNVSNIDYANDAFYREPVKFTDCATAQCFKSAVAANMSNLQAANTFTAFAIERAVKVYFASSPPGAEKFMIVTTDGAATDVFALQEKSQLAVDDSIISYAIGIGSKAVDSQLKEIARSSSRVFRVTSFSGFTSILQSVVAEIVPDPTTTPVASTTKTTEATTESTTVADPTTTTQAATTAKPTVGTEQPQSTTTATTTTSTTATPGCQVCQCNPTLPAEYLRLLQEWKDYFEDWKQHYIKWKNKITCDSEIQ